VGKPEFHLDQEIARADRAYVTLLNGQRLKDITIAPHGPDFALRSNTPYGDEMAHELLIAYAAPFKAIPIGGGWYCVSAADMPELLDAMECQGVTREGV
jgi:hypothetical protein